MTSELLQALVRASWTVGLAILLILLAGPALRRLFGSQVAYMAWTAVPVGLAAASVPLPHPGGPMLEVAAPVQALAAQSAQFLPADSNHWAEWIGGIWLLGCLAMLVSFWRAHARYAKELGTMEQAGGLLYCANNSMSPAVIGLWRHAIVVPSDFSSRYSEEEQRLILAHEKVHAARHDPMLNALCALIQCGLWFHPLVHLGARRFRLDQELACDATVMRNHSGLRRSYADAMLKTQLSSQATLIHCHWQSIHPLKERIMHLKQTPPRILRQLAGRVAVAVLVASSGYVAVAAHAAPQAVVQERRFEVQMLLNVGGESSSPLVRVKAGEPFAVSNKGVSGTWRGEFVMHKINADSVLIKSVFKYEDRVLANPSLMVKMGELSTVEMRGETEAETVKVQLTVTAIP